MDIEEARTRATLTIAETASLLRTGLRQTYEAAQSGDIPTLRLGRKYLVPTGKLFEMLGLNIDAEAPTSSVSAIPIEDLDLSVRTYNCLKREGINTVGDLALETAGSLAGIRNIRNGAGEITDRLDEIGVSLAQPTDIELARYDRIAWASRPLRQR